MAFESRSSQGAGASRWVPGLLPIIKDASRAGPSLPTVRALEALWTSVSEKPLYAPPNFWRYLRLRWRTRLALLDPGRVQVLVPEGKVNDCKGCTETCCMGPSSTVLLRLRDIATLIDIEQTEFMAQSKPVFEEEQLTGRPALRRHVSSRAWAIFPVLKQNTFGACTALTPEGTCSLHPHWPLSCDRFPYALHADDWEIFYAPRCDSFWIRPDETAAAQAMAVSAVAAYNERIKDLILLEYAPDALDALGLTRYLGGRPHTP